MLRRRIRCISRSSIIRRRRPCCSILIFTSTLTSINGSTFSIRSRSSRRRRHYVCRGVTNINVRRTSTSWTSALSTHRESLCIAKGILALFVLAPFTPNSPRNVRVPTNDLYAHIVLDRPRLSSSDGPLVFWYAISGGDSFHDFHPTNAGAHKQILVPSRINARKSPRLSLKQKVGHCALIIKQHKKTGF